MQAQIEEQEQPVALLSFFFPVRASALLYWSQSNLMEETRRGGRMLAVFPISQKAFRLR